MKSLPVAILLVAATAGAQTQLFLPASTNPASNELPNYNRRPFMQTDSRVQMFFDSTEVGATSFTIDAVALRLDGPVPQVGASGPFAIQRLRIKAGATGAAMPGADFARNLTQPLTTGLDAPWSFWPDPGSAPMHPFGGVNNSLLFPFTTPVPVTIPAGGWLVLEFVVQGNNIANFGYSHALIDGTTVPGGIANGSASAFGFGCNSPGGAAATIATTGTYAPGAAHFLNGQNLGANAPVFAVLGLNNTISAFGTLPFQLPGTTCDLLVRPDFYWLLLSNGSGAILPDLPGAALAVPALPVLNGMILFEQFASYVPGANAPWNLVLSNAASVSLGTLSLPQIGVYTVSHGTLHDAAVADKVESFGFAVRLTVH